MRRTVTRLGVRLSDEFFTDHLLARWVRRRVQIDRLSETQVQVADARGAVICVATRHRNLTTQQILEIVLTRSSLRSEDRKRFRRLLTQIEVDGRERALARAAATPTDASESIVDALFGRLPSELNKPAAARTAEPTPAAPTRRSDEPALSRTASPAHDAPATAAGDGSLVLNRPAPAPTAAIRKGDPNA